MAPATCDLRDRQTFLIEIVARDGSRPTTLLDAIDAIHRGVGTACRRSFPPTIGSRPEVIASAARAINGCPAGRA